MTENSLELTGMGRLELLDKNITDIIESSSKAQMNGDISKALKRKTSKSTLKKIGNSSTPNGFESTLSLLNTKADKLLLLSIRESTIDI